MKKILISILIILLIVLCYIGIMNGLNKFGIEILSVKQIKENNEKLDSKIVEATQKIEIEYPRAMTELNNDLKNLQNVKKEYEELIAINSSETTINQLSKYEIEYLWTKIGNHATSEGVEVKFTVSQSASGTEDVYDLKFTATGSYVAITDFISDIENDSDLGFTIENFNMIPSGETLQAIFETYDIAINIDKSKVESDITSNQNITNNAENTTDRNTNTTTDNTENITTDNTENTTEETTAQ